MVMVKPLTLSDLQKEEYEIKDVDLLIFKINYLIKEANKVNKNYIIFDIDTLHTPSCRPNYNYYDKLRSTIRKLYPEFILTEDYDIFNGSEYKLSWDYYERQNVVEPLTITEKLFSKPCYQTIIRHINKYLCEGDIIPKYIDGGRIYMGYLDTSSLQLLYPHYDITIEEKNYSFKLKNLN